MANTSEPEASEYKRKVIIHLTEDDLPALKKWDVGKKYRLEMTVKQISKSQGDPYGYGPEDDKKGKAKIEAAFEVLDVDESEKDEDDDDGEMDADSKRRAKEIGKKRYG